MRRLALFAAFVLLPFAAIGIADTLAPLSIGYFLRVHDDPRAFSTVAVQAHITQRRASAGGPQALEGYTLLDHDAGSVRLALGTIGNVEVHGAGAVAEIASLQAGGVVTGPGHVGVWSGLKIVRPAARTSAPAYLGPVNIDQFNDITFSNGWTIRTAGAGLNLCDPRGICRAFF